MSEKYKAQKKYYEKNKRKLNERDRQRMKDYWKNMDPEKKKEMMARKREAHKRWRLNNPEKYKERIRKSNEKWKEKRQDYFDNLKDNCPKKLWGWGTISSHKKKDYEIRFSSDQLYDYIKNIDHCMICGIELDWSRGNKNGKSQHNSPSIDRINNENYLTLDNIQITCVQCNATKRNRTMKEFIEYCKTIYLRNGNNDEITNKTE